ncbi:MAG: sensor histidine kinase [Eubacterium sp.]|nr:sensor histidine kinase [Eubacterium sp.]MBR4242086.1 sensor histidine kinase [Eubacterium sp.]MBR7060654.1 sensor histidine kinase [Eubacterium sp.]
MKELSLNILDVAENSVKAGASLTEILITEEGNKLTLQIKDNGCGMSEEVVKSVVDPFYTTRTTRKVGLGVPLLKLAAEQTEGSFSVESKTDEEFPEEHGTVVTAVFFKDHLDFTPLGDVVSSIVTLIQGHPDTDFYFSHTNEGNKAELDTRQLREVLGDVPLNSYEVIKWTEDYLREQYQGFNL